MYFYKKRGKQILDMQGDLVLTHNQDLVCSRSKSAGPQHVHNARWIPNIYALGFFGRLKAAFIVICFIFGKDKSLPLEDITNGEK